MKYVDAYTYRTPLVDTDTYMAWLLGEVLTQGARVEQRRLSGRLQDQMSDLLITYKADVIVNCTGLGARELASDDVVPVRGAWLLAENDGRRFPKVDVAHCSSLANSAAGGTFLFIVPRGRDRLIIGGIAQPSRWATTLGEEHEPITKAIFQNCLAFMPELADAQILDQAEVRVGLRPFHRDGVRVQRDADLPLVHNYGHGGAGVTLSWGAADDAALLAEAAVASRSEELMQICA